jgi:hypothetical protein
MQPVIEIRAPGMIIYDQRDDESQFIPSPAASLIISV